MVRYVGMVNSEDFIVSWRVIYDKYDEVGNVVPNSVEEQMKDYEVLLPVKFAELVDLLKYKYVDGSIIDPETNEIVLPDQLLPNMPTLMQIKDKSIYTRMDYLDTQHTQVFHSPITLFWHDPKLYYFDVSDDFEHVVSSDEASDVMRVYTHNLIEYNIFGIAKTKPLLEKFLVMRELDDKIEFVIKAWSNGEQTEEVAKFIDEACEEIQQYL